jgi:hypothetical protein
MNSMLPASLTSLGIWARDVPWAWPIMEMLHYTGLCLLFGGLVLIDLRLLDLNRRLPPSVLRELLPLTYIGFLLNFATGTVFFVANPSMYADNFAFRLKMLLIALAGLNSLYYRLRLRSRLAGWNLQAPMPLDAKLVGGLSLLCWLGVATYGRLMP